MFTSLQFTPNQTDPPDANPKICWSCNPELCTGIALFDVFIGNDDRRKCHLAVDNPAKPTEIIPYDHDCAIASDMYGDAKVRFAKDFDQFLADNQCLIPFIDDDTHFPTWIARIESLPKWFIHEICMEARTKGFTISVAKAAENFLYWRSRNIRSILRKHKAKFTGITTWTVIL